LVQGNCRPPPTPTNKSSDPKILNHPFRSHGQPLPPRKMRQRHKPLRRCPGRRHWPRAPNTESGGGPSCMPMVFWAAQTMAASSLLGVREPQLTSYISLASAATTIQLACRFHLRWVSKHHFTTISMQFTRIHFHIQRSCCPFDQAVTLAYKKYIYFKQYFRQYDLNANFVRQALDYYHRECAKRQIQMDAEFWILHGVLDILMSSNHNG
jgi:hypothetical protein